MTWFAGLAVYLQQMGADAPVASLIVLLALCSAPVVLLSVVLGAFERAAVLRRREERDELLRRRGASRLGKVSRQLRRELGWDDPEPSVGEAARRSTAKTGQRDL